MSVLVVSELPPCPFRIVLEDVSPLDLFAYKPKSPRIYLVQINIKKLKSCKRESRSLGGRVMRVRTVKLWSPLVSLLYRPTQISSRSYQSDQYYRRDRHLYHHWANKGKKSQSGGLSFDSTVTTASFLRRICWIAQPKERDQKLLLCSQWKFLPGVQIDTAITGQTQRDRAV